MKHDETHPSPLALSAIILAGGASTRMGRDKAWMEIAGRPLIELALQRVRELGIMEVFISGRIDSDYSMLRLPVLFDLEPGFGPVAGIERGLHQCAAPLLLVLAVDLPRMSTACLRKLLGHCDRLTGVVPRLNGRFEPLVAVYPKRCHAFAFAAISRGQHAVQDFVRACLTERAIRAVPVSQADAGCFANCNTPAELVRSHPDSQRAEHLFPR